MKPQTLNAKEFGYWLMDKGIETSFSSGYLKENNYIQIAIMSQHTIADAEKLIALVNEYAAVKNVEVVSVN